MSTHNFLNNSGAFLHALVTEKRCAYCQSTYNFNDEIFFGLCPQCSSNIKRIKNGYCKTCGTVQDISLEHVILEKCDVCDESRGGKAVLWSEVRFFGVYENVLADIIRSAKFYQTLIFTRTLGSVLSPLLEEFSPFDMLIPLPIHDTKIVERGFNQCIEIAKFAQTYSDIDFDLELNALHKTVVTKPQSTLSRKERLNNVRGTFQADRARVEGKTIVLLDDVSTTGSTLRAATKALLDAKAEKVFVLYAAGTPLHKE